MGVGWLGKACMWFEKMWWMAGWLGANFGSSQPADLIPLCVIPPSPLRGDGENGCVGFPALSTDLYLFGLVWFVSKYCIYFDT